MISFTNKQNFLLIINKFLPISWQTVGNPDIHKKVNLLSFTMAVTVFQASRDGPRMGFGDVSKDLRE